MLGEYYVVFQDSEKRGTQWLRPHFRHCFVVRNDGDKVWTVIEDTKKRLAVTMLRMADYPNIEDFCLDGATVMEVDLRIEDRYRGWLCWFNCVEVVKAVLGIKKFWIFTPYQLYRYLLWEKKTPLKK